MIKTYCITLTPTGKFFFGGEMTFKVKNEDDKYNEQYSSYIISSNRMPQQTSLLGMLRFLILRNAGTDVFADGRIVSKDKAADIIGRSSFKINADDHNQNDFGTIHSITPCFLMEGNEHVKVFCNVDPSKFDMKNCSSAILNGNKVCLPDSKYNPKEQPGSPMNDYFKEDQRMGLNKDYDGRKKKKDDDTDLFKQINLRLNEEKNLKFAFYANIDSSILLSEYDGQIVTLGADNSTFIINIIQEDYKEAKANKLPDCNSIVLTSPTYIKSEDLGIVSFATTDIIPFRFLSTSVETKSYNRLGGYIKQGTKYNLYDTGSVFYFDSIENMNKFAEVLRSYEDFRQIGYNYFIINEIK